MTYIKYKIRNVEPLRIADDSSSHNGQAVTLRYIPGTTIRGYLINCIAKKFENQFEDMKKDLFSSRVVYMNAYLSENNRELIPSPKGFYEDKTVVSGKKKIQNVVIDGAFSDGYKRAGLGRFCYFEKDTIFFYNVTTGSDMKILINKRKEDDKQNVIRNEYISPQHEFVGYIKVENEALAQKIMEVLEGTLALGNARSQGLGKCLVVEKEKIETPYIPYREYVVDRDAKNSCYMMLLSHMTMRDDYGEFVGINLKEIEKKLGVTNLEVAYCSTSTIDVKGYNRVWGNKIPSVSMYEQGSVFQLKFEGIAKIERMKQMMQDGLGVRINEGFGRVIFLKNYEQLKYKQEGKIAKLQFTNPIKKPSDDANLKLIAKNYYISKLREKMQKQILNGVNQCKLPKSQVGNVRALIEGNRYDAISGTQVIKNYFMHSKDKEERQKVQKNTASIQPFREKIESILDKPLTQTLGEKMTSVMGISVEGLVEDAVLQRMKFDYILELMKYDNRKGDAN